MFEFAAFLSYSHRWVEWVEVLQENLEMCLQAEGHEPAKVFRDGTDVGAGFSWVERLQQGLDRAERVVLVVTPESMASPRVGVEWKSVVTRFPDWKQGRIQIAMLVDAPLPPFLEDPEYVDFRDHDEEMYRQGLRELVGALIGHTDKRNLPELPDDLVIPDPPSGQVPAALRNELVRWLESRLRRKIVRKALAPDLGLDLRFLEAHPSWRCAASAALVRFTGGDVPVKAAIRFLDVLSDTLGEDHADGVAMLVPLRAALEKEVKRGGGGLLHVYLKCIAGDHERLVSFFQREAELEVLDRVYVELELAKGAFGGQPGEVDWERKSDGRSERRRRDDVPRGPFRIRELLALSRDPGSGLTGRWVILGDPGSGKTTLLRHLAASLAAEDDPSWLPLFESLPRWVREPDALPQRIELRLRRAGHRAEGFQELCEQFAENGRVLLLLDGLDEVTKERRGEAEKLLRDLAQLWPSAAMLVTSRPIGYRRPADGLSELRLLPLDRERRGELLARWLGRAAAQRNWAGANTALAILEKDPGLWDLAGNPLYLTLMAMIIEKGAEPDHNRARLYDQIFQLLMDGRHRPEPVPMEAKKTTRGVLRRLAYDMTEDNRDVEPREDLEARLLTEDFDLLRSRLERVPRWRRNLHVFFDDLSERTGILGPHDGEYADWRYWHRTFREALTAESLEEQMERDGASLVLARAAEITGTQDESRWAESFAILTGRVQEPDQLVRDLIAANRPLGLRALASARTLQEDTIVEVLGLTGDVKARAQVYQQLPRLLPEGRPLLKLVDRLGNRETTDGTDLFWLDWIASQVGKREEALRLDVDAFRRVLFERREVDERQVDAAFCEVETEHDGRIPAWSVVKADEFWMGSSSNEKHHAENEGPRHLTRFVKPFRISAIPVTNAQFRIFNRSHKPFRFGGISMEDLNHHPVVNVTWFEAMAFCRWLGEVWPEGQGARLPTESEWEFACRAGTDTAFWSGNSIGDLKRVGWISGNSEGRTHRVGRKPANKNRLFDMHGNVWEWTLSRYTADYSTRGSGTDENPCNVHVDGLLGNDPGAAKRIVRGGSYWNDARSARAAFRDGVFPWYEWRILGFRIVLPCA